MAKGTRSMGPSSRKDVADVKTDQMVLDELAKAASQYETYVRLSSVTAALPDEATTTPAPLYDWNHPLGLIINS